MTAKAVQAKRIKPDSVRKSRWIIAFAIWSLWAYLLIVFSSISIFGVSLSLKKAGLILVLSAALIYWLVTLAERRGAASEKRLRQIALACIIALVSMIGFDMLYSIYLKSAGLEAVPDADQTRYARLSDGHVWRGEFEPESYYPTEKNFQVFKPDVTIDATVYGQMYSPRLLASPTLANSVLESRHQVISIDSYGFRETSPMEGSRIFALGDSYTEGLNVSQEDIWVEVLQRRLDEPVYNLGKSATSPMQQLMLLEHLLEERGDSIQIDRLLWMIFEANDLEESYRELRPTEETASSSILSGTVLGAVMAVPEGIREESVINRLLTGRLIALESTQHDDHYVIDGVKLHTPLYYSEQHGYRLFEPLYTQRAAMPRSYVLNHKNRKPLERTFADMKALSERHGFGVTVVIAPSAPRLYGPYFEDFPAISQEPHFINFVEGLASDTGFEVVNLYTTLKPYAETELLHARDDTHWNERGNELAAEIVYKEAFGE